MHSGWLLLSAVVGLCVIVAINTVSPPASRLMSPERIIYERERYLLKRDGEAAKEPSKSVDLTPLYLTPLLKQGKIAEAQNLSRVRDSILLPKTDTSSYTGFITIDENAGSNMFFWFVSATKSLNNSLPVMVWLQGGPGASSMFGLFTEHGPYRVDARGIVLARKENAWSEFANMLYIDNPVGVGFSYTQAEEALVQNEKQVGENLLLMIDQWFQLYPMFRHNGFFVAGESYGGKYAPAMSFYLMKAIENPTDFPNVKVDDIKFKGMLVGDGFSDPITMLHPLGDHLYSIGMFSRAQADFFNERVGRMIVLEDSGDYMDAFKVFDYLLNGDLIPKGTKTFFQNATGCVNYFNYPQCSMVPGYSYYGKAMNNPHIQALIHVGDVPYNDGNSTVEMKLVDDMLQPVTDMVEYLLSKRPSFKILYYSGNLDLIVSTVGTEAWLRTLSIAGQYKTAKRTPWKLNESDDVVAGYETNVDGFRFVVIANSGHMVPFDQPAAGYKMAKSFVHDAMM